MKRNYIYKSVSVSTNTELKAAVRASALPVTDVLRAGTQTGGRGRRDKAFFSPAGGIYFSAAYPLAGDETNVPFLTLLAGLAVCRALESACPAEYKIKWPNDIYLRGRKLSGILTELVSADSRNTAVVGVGINAGVKKEEIPPALQSVMTSLCAENLTCPDADHLVKSIVALLDRYVYDLSALRGNTLPFVTEINARAYLTDRTVTVETGEKTVTGRVIAVSPTGTLLLDTAEGEAEIFSGTVILN